MVAIASRLGAAADVAGSSQTFLIPFSKDFIQRNVLLDKALARWLSLPCSLLFDEDSTGNNEYQYAANWLLGLGILVLDGLPFSSLSQTHDRWMTDG